MYQRQIVSRYHILDKHDRQREIESKWRIVKRTEKEIGDI